MRNVSTAFHEAALSSDRTIAVKAIFNGTIEIDGAHIIDISISETLFSEQTLTMGEACSRKAVINMYMPDSYVPVKNGCVELYVGLLVDGATEYCPLGKFYISATESVDDYKTVTITAFDLMSKLNLPYSKSESVDLEVGGIMGVMDDIASQNGNFAIASGYDNYPLYEIPSGITSREILGYAAGLNGGNARFGRDEIFEFAWYKATGIEIGPDAQYQNGFKRTSEHDYTINSLTSGTAEESVTSGSGRGPSFANPFMTQEILDSVLEKVNGFTYTPCEVRYRGDPSIEAGDIVTVIDVNGNHYTVPVMSHELKISGGMTATITAVGLSEEAEIQNVSPTAQILERYEAKMLAVEKAVLRSLTAEEADIRFAKITDLNATDAKIDRLVATSITTYNLTAKVGELGYLKADMAEAKYANISELESAKATISKLTSNVADIEKAYITRADVEVLVADKGYLTEAQVNTLVVGKGYLDRAEAEELIVDKGYFTEAQVETLVTTKGYLNEAQVNTLITSKGYFTEAELETLIVRKGYITEAKIGTILVDYATVSALNVAKADIGTLQTRVADIGTLMFGSTSGSSLTTKFSNTVIGLIGDATIAGAKIIDLDAGKIKSGTLDTSLVTVKSKDGNLQISGDVILVKDANRTRVQLGKDANGDYNIYVVDASGKVMFDATGIHSDAIKSPIIENAMVADDANISANKLDIDSLFTEINGSANTIKSTKIYLDDKKQTLDVAFSSVTETVTGLGNTVSSQGTAISTIQGQITNKIWQQDINTVTNALGDRITTQENNYTEVSEGLNGIKTTVSSHTSQIATKADGSIVTALENRVAIVETTASGLTVSLQSTNEKVTTAQNTANAAQAAASNAQSTANSAKTTADAAKKQLYHSAGGTTGTAGFVAFAKIVVNGGWQNRPILFTVNNRGKQSTNVSFALKNVEGKDPAIEHLQYDGGIGMWAYKYDTSTWYIIGKKSEGYDTLYITDFVNNNGSVSVSWINTHYSSLPTSNITEGTLLAAKITKATVDAAVEAAAATATNFMLYDGKNGLLIGNKSNGSWSGYRAQVLPTAFNILDASGNTLASYGEDIKLGDATLGNKYIDFVNGPDDGNFLALSADDIMLYGNRSASMYVQGQASELWTYLTMNGGDIFMQATQYDTDDSGSAYYAGAELTLTGHQGVLYSEIIGSADVITLTGRNSIALTTPKLTLEGEVLFNTGTNQSATKGIKWAAINSKNPYIGYALNQSDGTFIIGSLLGTNYQDGLAIGGGSGNLLYKGNVVLHAGNYTSYCAPATHNHAASAITSGTLAVARGGTGVTSNPSMLVNLASTSAASVFAASPRPGVTGTLPLGNGGTGGTTAAAARTNLATWMYDLVTNTSYPGLARPDGTTTGYVRTPESGLLPYKTGGSSNVGTSSWPFSNGYFTNLYKNGKAVATTDHSHAWATYTPTAGSSQISIASCYAATNAAIDLAVIRMAVTITPTEDISAGASIKVATFAASAGIIPNYINALSVYVGTTNSRRWMAAIGPEGEVVVRGNSTLTKGTAYTIYITGVFPVTT